MAVNYRDYCYRQYSHQYHHHHRRNRKTSQRKLTRRDSYSNDNNNKTKENSGSCSRLLKHFVEWFCNKIGSTQSHHHTTTNTATSVGIHNDFETIADAQEALWFVRESIEKKKRLSDHQLNRNNNTNTLNSSTSKDTRRSIRDPTKERTYTKYPSEIDLYQYRRQQQLYNNNQYPSLALDHQYIDDSNDYYNNGLLPICSGNNGNVVNGPTSGRTSQNGSTTTGRATLRRSRSLAVTREDIYTDLQNHNIRTKQPPTTVQLETSSKNRRSQLIPRARLIDKGSFKERPTYQNLELNTNKRISSRSNSITDYYQGGINENQIIPVPQKLEKLQTVLSSWPETHNIIQTYPQIHKKEAQLLDSNSINDTTSSNNDFDEPEYIHSNPTHIPVAGRKSLNPSEIDSLDSNFQNKSSTSYVGRNEDNYNDSSDELEKPNNLGLNLPNYYPDSVYDTDLSLTHCHNSTFDLDEQPILTSKRILPEINITSYDSSGEKEANIDEEIELASKVYQTDSSTLTVSEAFNSFVDIPLNPQNEEAKELIYSQLDFKPKVVGTEIKKPTEYNIGTYDQLQPKKSDLTQNKIKNFINKNIISVFHADSSSSKRNNNKTDESSVRTASESQFYSLPDVTICKSLRKCARIDAKLRQIENTENRFVVNIGPQILETDTDDINLSSQIDAHQSVPIEIATKCKISTEKLDGQSGASSLDINLDTFHDEINVNSLINANNDKITIQVAGTDCEKDNQIRVEEDRQLKEIQAENDIHTIEENKFKLLAGKQKTTDSYKLYCTRTEIKIHANDKFKSDETKQQNLNDKNCAMPRPQIINIIKDAKQSQIHHNSVVTLSNDTLTHKRTDIVENIVANKQDNNNVTIIESSPTPSSASSTPKEYEEKLNSVKDYWDKMIDKCDVEIKKMGQSESTKPKITHETPKKVEEPEVKIENNIPKKVIEVPTINIENVRKIFESNGVNEEVVEESPPVSQVEQCRKLFEPIPEVDPESEDSRMGVFVKESCSFFEKAYGTIKKSLIREPEENKENIYESINYNLEIDDSDEKRNSQHEDTNKEKSNEHVIVRRTKSAEEEQEFDHIRYKVMKSNLFQKSIYSNSKKEAQFDGLLQYLQDYSFQELLVNNNVVIIEPVRTKFERDESKTSQSKLSRPISNNSLPHRKISIVNESAPKEDINQKKSNLKKHFFYHPIRVNRELIEEELPDPETVRKVRTFFEKEFGDEATIAKKLTKSQSTKNLSETKPKPRKRILRYLTVDTNYGNKWDSGSLSSGVSSGGSELCCDELSPKSNPNDNLFSSEENVCDPDLQYDASISQDVLKKIRECGTTITYYGGKVVNAQNGPLLSPMRSIMDEIKQHKNTKKPSKTSTLEIKKRQQIPTTVPVTSSQTINEYQGIRFKLVKSNSCSSRLELIGAATAEKPLKSKYFQKRKSCNDVKILENLGHNQNKENLTDSFKSTEFIEKTQQNKINVENNINKPLQTKITNNQKEFSTANSQTKFGEMIFEEFEVADSLKTQK